MHQATAFFALSATRWGLALVMPGWECVGDPSLESSAELTSMWATLRTMGTSMKWDLLKPIDLSVPWSNYAWGLPSVAMHSIDHMVHRR